MRLFSKANLALAHLVEELQFLLLQLAQDVLFQHAHLFQQGVEFFVHKLKA